MRSLELERVIPCLPLTTRGGDTAWLSALAPGDQEPVRAVFDGLSDRSRYFRFLVATPRMSGFAARRLSDVDHRRHVALVATVEGRAAGIGRYVREADDPRRAEIAFAVVDALQGRGLGNLLLAALGAVAADHGVTTFTYLVHQGNAASLALLRRIGGTSTRLDGDLVGSGPVPASLLAPETARQLARLVHEVTAPTVPISVGAGA
jgi:GNAT superfamily N-acetyltransferase